jgi:aryl-alcohol dehydrogenase-like predicted oxidoreductase
MLRSRRRFIATISAITGGLWLKASTGGATLDMTSESDRAGQLVRFGDTDLFVSRICQGTGRMTDDESAQSVLRRCLELGINFFDSSNMYGWGNAEIALGKALKGQPRDKLVICTKVWPGTPPTGLFARWKDIQPAAVTREFATRALEQSLRRLGTDYVDLYMLHAQDPSTDPADLVETMDALVKSGKVRYWGVSNHSGEQVSDLVAICQSRNKTRIAGTQDPYNLLYRAAENYLFPVLRKTRMGLMAYSPLAGGQLAAGKAASDSAIAPVLRELDRIAGELNVSRTQVAIAWALSRPEVTSIISGSRKIEHVDENFAGAHLALPADAIRSLATVSASFTQVR